MNANLLKRSQIILLAIVFILSIAVTVFLVRQEQDPRNRADTLGQTAVTSCSANGIVHINLRFTNDSSSVVNISARDLGSGGMTDLGSINPNTTSNGIINTEKISVDQNIVVFENSAGETTTATYNALDCSANVRTCAVTEAKCSWDAVDNATEYKVKITESETGDLIKDVKVVHPTTSFVFPAQPGISYTCEVTPMNSCGEADKSTGEGSCPVATPSPTDVPIVTDVFNCTGTTPSNASMWDAEESAELTSNTAKTHSDSDTAVKCQYHCDVNYTWDGDSCERNTYSCTGNIPANGSLCPGDDSELTSNLPWLQVSSCDNSRKCQYTYVVPTPTTISAQNTLTPTAKVNSPTPTIHAVGGGVTLTPTPIQELPPTGLTQDVMIITIIGSSIILLGSFVLIFLW